VVYALASFIPSSRIPGMLIAMQLSGGQVTVTEKCNYRGIFVAKSAWSMIDEERYTYSHCSVCVCYDERGRVLIFGCNCVMSRINKVINSASAAVANPVL